MANFKVGDRVRKISIYQGAELGTTVIPIGATGVIVAHIPNDGYDWRVQYDCQQDIAFADSYMLAPILPERDEAFERFMARVRGEPVELAHALLDRVRGGAQ